MFWHTESLDNSYCCVIILYSNLWLLPSKDLIKLKLFLQYFFCAFLRWNLKKYKTTLEPQCPIIPCANHPGWIKKPQQPWAIPVYFCFSCSESRVGVCGVWMWLFHWNKWAIETLAGSVIHQQQNCCDPHKSVLKPVKYGNNELASESQNNLGHSIFFFSKPIIIEHCRLWWMTDYLFV